MRKLALLMSLLLAFSVATEAFACGGKKYDLQTEVEINGQVMHPEITAVDRETVVSKTTTAGIETTVQVFAEELWDETSQGDAVKLKFKVYQSKGRQSLGDASFELITRYGQTAEMRADGGKTSKLARLKVTAKKI